LQTSALNWNFLCRRLHKFYPALHFVIVWFRTTPQFCADVCTGETGISIPAAVQFSVRLTGHDDLAIARPPSAPFSPQERPPMLGASKVMLNGVSAARLKRMKRAIGCRLQHFNAAGSKLSADAIATPHGQPPQEIRYEARGEVLKSARFGQLNASGERRRRLGAFLAPRN
jgi:hypothetical protein